ncbi:Cytosolic endo-beta-n-acetylglucosaminidase, partial [Thalictrum thalictroides]
QKMTYGTGPSFHLLFRFWLSLVTIPPPCWINTTHKHSVKVLGTFITKWDEGRAICNTLLLTKESAEM